jgi:hypothetical protein
MVPTVTVFLYLAPAQFLQYFLCSEFHLIDFQIKKSSVECSMFLKENSTSIK